MGDRINAGPERAALLTLVSSARERASVDVGFAVSEGPTHVIRYANAAFHRMLSDGEISIGRPPAAGARPTTDLTALLDRALLRTETITDELVAPAASAAARWSCSVWPIPADVPALAMEVRAVSSIQGTLARQRILTERLLVSALREQELARQASEDCTRAVFLAEASRDLAMSLDQDATRAAIQRRTLPRRGSWCIVDVMESNETMHRLGIVHPDPQKHALARMLPEHWTPAPEDPIAAGLLARAGGGGPIVITPDSRTALEAAAHGAENLAILRTLGFGGLLVVPLRVRTSLLGAITFVTREGDPPLTPEEITLAADIADRCALALDSARLYRETDALREAANAASRAKSAFLGNMSHELMTPLNAIGGYAEVMEMGLRGPVTEEQRTDLIRIKQNQSHLLTLIMEILSLVRADSGRMEFRFGDVPVASALAEVAEMLGGAVKERKLALELRPGDVDAVAWADRDRVRQILINLVMNAVKYTSVVGGTITISTGMTVDTVIIGVADTGAGIPPERLEEIFEPFVQLVGGLATRQGGVGLGLSISRDLARAMLGNLTVESTPGVGSRFVLTLPRARSVSRSGTLAAS